MVLTVGKCFGVVDAVMNKTAIAFVQFVSTIKNRIGSQGQMIADDYANFAVEQNCRIGMESQNIGSGTCINGLRPLQNPPPI